ncbi:MAG: hypothetical protein ABFD12_02175 [Syntrophorhabdus sp.]
MMRQRLPNTVQDWEKMLKRVYETQGPSAFAKYQYSVSTILQLTKTGPSLQKMLEYCKDIPNPKDVLIDAISEVMRDHNMEVNVRIAATVTLRALMPRIQDYPGFKGATIIDAMEEVLGRTRDESFRDALTETINAANRKMQECPRMYAIKL